MAEEESMEFLDAESSSGSYKQKGQITFEQIVLKHIHTICKLSTKEFRGGYTNKQIVVLGGGLTTTNETYISDARACYIQAVDSLYDMLYCFFDKTINAKDGQLKEEMKDKKDNALLIVKRQYFRELCSLLKRLNFLKEESID